MMKLIPVVLLLMLLLTACNPITRPEATAPASPVMLEPTGFIQRIHDPAVQHDPLFSPPLALAPPSSPFASAKPNSTKANRRKNGRPRSQSYK